MSRGGRVWVSLHILTFTPLALSCRSHFLPYSILPRQEHLRLCFCSIYPCTFMFSSPSLQESKSHVSPSTNSLSLAHPPLHISDFFSVKPCSQDISTWYQFAAEMYGNSNPPRHTSNMYHCYVRKPLQLSGLSAVRTDHHMKMIPYLQAIGFQTEPHYMKKTRNSKCVNLVKAEPFCSNWAHLQKYYRFAALASGLSQSQQRQVRLFFSCWFC